MQFRIAKRFALATILMGAATASAHSSCQTENISVRGDWGSAKFSIEVADDFAERAQGLMHRQSMPTLAGMLFIYENPGNLTFWMRNTLIPLDMIFIKPDGTVAHVHENAIPLDETPIPGGEGNLAVLEINGGLSRRLGIEVGDHVQHLAFSDQNPVWPCS
jgi:uncharacterized membrane protein (UPF0127 family)